MRTSVISVLALTASIALIAGCSNQPDVVTIGYQVTPYGELIAKNKGWYEKELGTKVVLKAFDSGRDLNTAFASHAIQFGLLGSTPAAVGIASGNAVKLVYVNQIIGSGEALAVKTKAKIASIKDLKGKRVGVPFASTTHYALLQALKQEGVDAKDVKILDLQPQDLFAAWTRGDVDAGYVWEPTYGKLVAEGGQHLTDSGILAGKGIVTALVELVDADFAKKYPDVVVKYLKVQQKALDLYKTNPDDAAAALAPELGVDKTEALKEASGFIWLGLADQAKYLGTTAQKGPFADTLKSTADFLAEQKAIQTAPDLDGFRAVIDTSFVEAALK
jgi:taurine transport system substrate-binding protein